MDSYPLANLITDCEAGASTASDSSDDCAPGLDAADDGGRDLLLEFTSECELGEIEVDPPAVDGAVDAPTVDDAPVPVYVETAFAPLSVPIIVVTAPAIPPVTVRSRLTTDWQMQAARAAVVVRRRTWTIPRPWQRPSTRGSLVQSGQPDRGLQWVAARVAHRAVRLRRDLRRCCRAAGHRTAARPYGDLA